MAFFRQRTALQLEILALRHQLGVLQRSVKRPKLTTVDRFLWAWLSAVWTDWQPSAIIMKPATVIGWHRKGFGLFWTWKIRRGKLGRPAVPADVRSLICAMSRDNPLWGAPRIHGELLKLGIAVSETSVSKYMVRHHPPRVPGPRHRVRRTELVPSPAKFRGLLSSKPDAPGIGEGHTGAAPDSIGGHGAGYCDARSRRTPSSLRAPRRIKVSSARFHPHRPVPLRGPIDRNRVRAREPLGIAERGIVSRRRGASEVQRLSLKAPKSCESGPIRR